MVSHLLLRACVIATMLIAFLGQALAYGTMSCDMTNSMNNHLSKTHSMMMSNKDMDHSMMDQSMMNSDCAEQDDDCCQSDCKCPTNACTSVNFLTSEMVSTHIDLFIDKVSDRDIIILQAEHKSLFRPPIFA